ncbi:MAG: PDZ domain-containing protein [Bacteroidales bacterium]|nr:PDZ domain-containing protein [Clostridium sp.]MCM1202647.1 PDZ domain-containing protein [Bacteroidales bacterium]
MKRYKRFLQYILTVNLLFILVVAGMGYQKSKEQGSIKEVTGTADTANRSGNAHTAKSAVRKVVPVGKTVGIYINTKGILVIDTGEVISLSGETKTPARNKLKTGDYITMLNGNEVHTKKQLVKAITDCGGETLVFHVNRNGEETDVRVEPVETGVDTYKVGIWVRDDLQGLGTITYMEENEFGALGHSINDMDTGECLAVSGGELYEADIYGVEKGTAGKPGEIEGMIAYETENVVGLIEDNRIYGIFGTVTEEFQQEMQGEEAVEVADIGEVQIGKAYIQSYVSGQKEQYEIEIINIHKNKNGDQEMEILVTDEQLLSLTGGIIQGMSGSPILQNGKLAGAVTHVFVEEPAKGYAIFAKTMENKQK